MRGPYPKAGSPLRAAELLPAEEFEDLPDVLASVFVGAELAGAERELDRATAYGVDLPDDVPLEPEDQAEASLADVVVDGVPQLEPREAVAFFRGKVPLRSKTVTGLVARARRRGLSVAREFLADVHTQMDELLGKRLAEGVDVQALVPELDALLQSVGLDPANPARLETIIRTNVQTAYSAGREAMLETPDLVEAFPYRYYETADDSAVRPEHAEMHGRVYHRDDAIWGLWTPPNGYNCRCQLVPMSLADVEAMGLGISRKAPKLDGVRVKPDEGFRFNGPQVYRTGLLEGLTKSQRAEASDVIAHWGRGRATLRGSLN